MSQDTPNRKPPITVAVLSPSLVEFTLFQRRYASLRPEARTVCVSNLHHLRDHESFTEVLILPTWEEDDPFNEEVHAACLAMLCPKPHLN